MTVIIQRGSAIEDRPCTIINRFTALTATGDTSPVESEGKLIKQADVSSITCKVYNSSGTLINTYTPVAATSVFDTIQTTLTWLKIDGGGNFRYTIPATAFPDGGVVNRVEVTITLTDGSLATGLWDIDVTGIYQS